MFRKRLILLVGAVLILSMTAQPTARAADRLPAADELVPRQAVIVLRITKPKAVLDLILRPELIEAVKASPAYRAWAAEPGRAWAAEPGFRQFQNVITSFERRFKTDWQTILRRLTGGGVTWAVGPRKSSLLIFDALDAEAPKALHDHLVLLVEADAEKKGKPSRVSSMKHGDVTIWSLGPKQAHAIVGKRLMVANRPEVLKAALDLRGGSGGKPVTSLGAYRQAVKAAGADAAGMLYANTAVLKKLPKIAKALDSKKNPLLALLAAPVTEAIGRSTWLALALRVKGDTLTIDAITDGTAPASGAARFAIPPKASGGAMPNLAVPRRIAAMSLYRDLRGFYAEKDKLFPERTSGLIFFENMMGIFFTGRDLTEEVLAEMGPQVRLVVAEQKYDPAIGTPAVRLPAFALVMRLKHPKRFSPAVEEAWQKAVGLINFTRGQQAQPGLIIDRPVYRGTKYTVACFTPPVKKDKKPLDMRFNFRPALAMPGSHLILSSTDGLAEDLMDALSKETANPPKPLAGLHSTIEIDGPQLASILAANRENLIRQNMVDKGNTRKQADSELSVLFAIVKRIRRVKLTLGADKGRSKMSLEIQLNLPSQRGGRGGK